MVCNRGIYHRGWTACTKHTTPWIMMAESPPLDDDVWELYGPDDWSQAHDLAKEMPDKLHELQRLFLIEAVKYNVLPLDDRKSVKFNPEIAGRPQLIRGNTPPTWSVHARVATLIRWLQLDSVVAHYQEDCESNQDDQQRLTFPNRSQQA